MNQKYIDINFQKNNVTISDNLSYAATFIAIEIFQHHHSFEDFVIIKYIIIAKYSHFLFPQSLVSYGHFYNIHFLALQYIVFF
jgi:hypothetical protein